MVLFSICYPIINIKAVTFHNEFMSIILLRCSNKRKASAKAISSAQLESACPTVFEISSLISHLSLLSIPNTDGSRFTKGEPINVKLEGSIWWPATAQKRQGTCSFSLTKLKSSENQRHYLEHLLILLYPTDQL